jgi:hypothetical protein
MKKVFTLIALVFVLISRGQAQEKLKVFKFQPLPLATSMLAFGIESFNEDRTRSTVFNLGIRYKKDNDRNYSYAESSVGGGDFINQFSDWKGIMGSLERRFYVPEFMDKEANMLNQKGSQSGVYFSPSLRIDFNQSDYDRSYYNYIYIPETQTQTSELLANSGKINFIGIMPSLNFGVQFTIFQYAYIDLHIGGGIRVQWENLVEQQSSGNNSYYREGGIIEGLVIKEGVQPTGGITFGLKL